ncbi:MAG: universal stress protein [Actinomycetota bacterium]
MTGRDDLGAGRILVGTDGSERAAVAVAQGARIASCTGSQLDLLFVIDPGRPYEGEVEEEALQVLADTAELARGFGVEATTSVVAGEPAHVLVQEAAEHEVELICVGADAGLLDRPLKIGKVATHVVQEASSSVLVARPVPEGFPARIVCGVDGSDASTNTASIAAQLAVASGAELRILHVIPVFRGKGEEWTVDPAVDEIPEELTGSVEIARAAGVEPLLEMAMGRPESALVKVAERDGADLLVIGHRGISGMTRMLLGSVSAHVTSHARCSVFVVRPEDAGTIDGDDG